MKPVQFETDWGLSFFERFKKALLYTLGFAAFVITLAEVRSSFTISILSLLVIVLIGVLFSVLVGLRVAFTGIAIIRFEEEGISFVSISNRKLNWGKEKKIPYNKCKVVEAFYWKFINHYFLRFYHEEKLTAVIAASVWEKSYELIKEQIQERFPENQYEFKK